MMPWLLLLASIVAANIGVFVMVGDPTQSVLVGLLTAFGWIGAPVSIVWIIGRFIYRLGRVVRNADTLLRQGAEPRRTDAPAVGNSRGRIEPTFTR
jgi:hypothetical protein